MNRQLGVGLLLVCLLAIVVVSVWVMQPTQNPKTDRIALPSATIPEGYKYLPKSGLITCNGPEIAVWEFPGLIPGDLNSATYSNSGKILGYLKACESVLVSNVQWSTWDSEFYLAIETKHLKGWVPAKYVSLSVGVTTTPTP